MLRNLLNPNDFIANIADMDNEFLTVDQAAQKLQMHVRTIRRLLANGQLPGQKIGARQWRISAAALKTYVETGSKPAAVKATTE